VNVRLRPAIGEDESFARRTHHDAFRDVVTRQFGRFDEAEQDRFFDAEWDPESYDIVEIDTERAGYVQISDEDDAIKVKMIVLAPQFQNRGAGTNLMNEVLERGRSTGLPVWLGALHENRRAQDLYRRLGFRETGKTDTHVLMEWRG